MEAQDEDDEIGPDQEEATAIQAEMAKRMKNAVAMLMEVCDSVQIVGTMTCQKFNGTVSYSVGGGNYFARYGAVKSWVKQQE